MVQDAVIIRLLDEGKAEVSVKRASACGKNCSSCEGCSLQNEFRVIARNSVNARHGAKVLIQSSSQKVFGAVFLVYLVPIFSLLVAYFLAYKLGCGEGACIAFGFAGLFASIIIMLLIGKCLKTKNTIGYIITKELN